MTSELMPKADKSITCSFEQEWYEVEKQAFSTSLLSFSASTGTWSDPAGGCSNANPSPPLL
jgi:hypothetical protein